MPENYQNKYYAELLDKLILNKEQKDMESFITNIFNFYNYIYINNPHLQKQFIDNLTLIASRIIFGFSIKSNIFLFLQAVNKEIFNKLII